MRDSICSTTLSFHYSDFFRALTLPPINNFKASISPAGQKSRGRLEYQIQIIYFSHSMGVLLIVIDIRNYVSRLMNDQLIVNHHRISGGPFGGSYLGNPHFSIDIDKILLTTSYYINDFLRSDHVQCSV